MKGAIEAKNTNPLSICTWFLKISISRNLFLNLIFELDFLSILNLILAGYTDSKDQVWNRQKIKFKNQFSEIHILKNQVQIVSCTLWIAT